MESAELEWVIVGGGIHGVHIAASLIGSAGVEREKIRIIDPGERLLSRWRTCTATTGMTHLRSPSVHHLDLHPWSLKRFAGKSKRRKRGLFIKPFDRPALDLFNKHSDGVIDAYRLPDIHVKDRVIASSVDCDGIVVELSGGTEMKAKNLVLAIGGGEQPQWPAWARAGKGRVHHVFEADFDDWPSVPEIVAVVGGGISAGQVALRLVDEGHHVHLISRHPLREHQFDSDPGWLGPKKMKFFARERDLKRRRALITKARHRGSVPPDVLWDVRRAIDTDQLQWHEAAIEGLEVADAGCQLQLSNETVVEVERVLLATGFGTARPGGAMIDGLIETASLPCASCGFPVVDGALRWHPRVYVSGPLAELELGPTARNIAGARRAGERLVAAIRREAPVATGMR